MKLSICCITYNHEKYVAKALAGFFEQKCDFDFDIIIADDHSKDRTVEIIKEIQQKYDTAGKIKLIARDKNIGIYVNFADAIKHCEGQYIAFCEGDDYWTDPLKLQKQVNYMDVHPGCSMTFHDVQVLNEKTGDFAVQEFDNGRMIDFDYVAEKITIANMCSIVIRNFFLELDSGWENKYKIGHDTLHFLSLMHGTIDHINGIMGVYRISGTGAWTGLNNREQNTIVRNELILYLKQFDRRFYKGFKRKLVGLEYDLSLRYLDDKQVSSFLKYQYYALSKSLKVFGWKYTFNLLKHSVKYATNGKNKISELKR